MNAIYDAIGVRMKSLPATPEKILQALKDKVPGREQYVQEARVQRAQGHRL
jgi:acid phosphatase family membrane protein YuiD